MIGIGQSSNLRYNLKQWLELKLLDNGMYAHAEIGDVSYAGDSNATLRKDGQFFESVANEWVYEEDVTVPSGYTAPISVSGVWVNGTFHAEDSSPYYPKVDYKRGRIIFTGTVPAASDLVQANFTYKDVSVDFVDSDNYNFLMSEYLHNPSYDSTDIFPSGITRLLPLVVVDLQTRDHAPRQIGGGKILSERVNFWVYAARDWERDAIMDIIFDAARETTEGADYNDVPEILSFYGSKAATYESYTDLGANYPWGRIYFDKMSIRSRELLIKLYKGRVEGLITLYQNP